MREWMQLNHPTALQWRRVRIGPLPSKELSRMYQQTLRWVDGIFIEDNIVHIIEAKLKPDPRAIGQLQLYRRLFSETPEFTMFHGFQVKTILLTTAKDHNVETLAADNNIEYVIYSPAWVKEVFNR